MGIFYNKLVRDKITDILDKKGVSYEKRIADDQEYRVELFKKLDEEVLEFKEDRSPEELADVIEVIESIKKLPEFSLVEEIRKTKKEERGGFEGRVILKGEYS